VLNSAVTDLARLLRRSRSPVNSDLRVAEEVARIVSLLTTGNNRSWALPLTLDCLRIFTCAKQIQSPANWFSGRLQHTL